MLGGRPREGPTEAALELLSEGWGRKERMLEHSLYKGPEAGAEGVSVWCARAHRARKDTGARMARTVR